MLVLTRKSGQKVIIANEIEITVLETKGDAVKIGIEAPRHITIYREEIFEEIRKTNRQATEQAQATTLDLAVETMNRLPSARPEA